MSGDSLPELQPELLDDFYSECDEHLGNVRTQLVKLESALAQGQQDSAALESLYRSFHSIKGNVAIVGLANAERVAHTAEDILRRLTRREAAATPELLDLLVQTGHGLEQMISAYRLQQPMPDGAELLQRLRGSEPEAPPAAAPDSVAASPRHGDAEPGGPVSGLAWRAVFSPSAELDRRGVNINSVRARLSALGEIVRAAPAIQPGGKMTFEFALALREPPANAAAWAADGVVLQPAAPAGPAPAAADPRAGGESSLFIAPSHIVRVDLGRLDNLMRIVGEMVIHRSRLEERIGRLGANGEELQEVALGLGRLLREMRESLTRVRLVPVAEIFSRLPFVVRDLDRDSGKRVRLEIGGQDTEIDKYLVERLKEPLLHLVRNAVSHGIEAEAERRAAGKTEPALLRLSAAAAGDSVVIRIRDNGRGVDVKRVAQRAAQLGVALADQPDSAELLTVLCLPGFSTREEADRASGRGVGMGVVASTVRELGGTLALETTPGQGTEFILRLPLMLSIVETFIVSAAEQTCAVPQGAIEEVVLIPAAAIRSIQGVEVAPYRSGVLPLVRLRALFGAEPSAKAELPVLVLGTERGLCGLAVDRVHGQREVVVRPMQDPLIRVPAVSGATELGDGKPVLILDAAALCRGAVRPRDVAAPARAAPAEPERKAVS